MNYRETTGEATSWVRAASISIENGYGEVPKAVFHEQEVTTVLGRTVISPVPSLSGLRVAFDTKGTFPLVHPETGAALGVASHTDVYVLLHSLYLHLAVQRDEAVAAEREKAEREMAE